MTVFRVQPANPLKTGIMIDDVVQGRGAILMVRGDADFPITDKDLPRLAESFVQALNGLTVAKQDLNTHGYALHFSPDIKDNVFHLRHRDPAQSQSKEGGISQSGLHFIIQAGVSDDARRALRDRLATPGVIQSWLDTIDMSGAKDMQATLDNSGPKHKPSF